MSKPRDTTPWRSVHGLLLLDKPTGLSSNQALQRARRLFLADKGGHTGSLDPLATGLLPLCFGEATKIAGFLLGSAKAYAAELRLGATTTTGDSDGDVVATAPVPALDAARIEAALAPLRGRITLTPPVYSALKQDGEPLYARARRGEDVTAPARDVDVHRLDLVDVAGDRVRLDVECGSGTYVRSLAVDFGAALGCGAHLTALRRAWVEPFRSPVMHTLESLEAVRDSGGLPALDALLLPIDAGLSALPCIALDAAAAARFRQGQTLVATAQRLGLCRVHGPGAHLLGLGDVDARGRLTVQRGLNLPA